MTYTTVRIFNLQHIGAVISENLGTERTLELVSSTFCNLEQY